MLFINLPTSVVRNVCEFTTIPSLSTMITACPRIQFTLEGGVCRDVATVHARPDGSLLDYFSQSFYTQCLPFCRLRVLVTRRPNTWRGFVEGVCADTDEGIETLRRGAIPSTVRTLEYRGGFRSPISRDMFPPFTDISGPNPVSLVTRLVLGGEFNHPVPNDTLPPSLEYLEFGEKFNQPLSGDILPPRLRKLVFGGGYNQPLPKNGLPQTLQFLRLGRDFNQTLDRDVLPRSLDCFVMDSVGYDHHFEIGALPPNLRFFRCGRSSHFLALDILPPSLEVLLVKPGLTDEKVSEVLLAFTRSNLETLVSQWDCRDLLGDYYSLEDDVWRYTITTSFHVFIRRS